MQLRSAVILTLTAAGMFGGGVLASDVSAAGTPTVSVVASGLNSPRGLAFAHGRLYVAEAGTGGTDCPAGAKGPTGGQLCVGRTSSLAWLSNGVAHPVLTGLISSSDLHGGLAAEGIEAVTGTKNGLRVVFGENVVAALTSLPHGAKFSEADNAAARHELGRLASGAPTGQVVRISP